MNSQPPPSPRKGTSDSPQAVFEIFVQKGFCELEVASITSTLQVANKICGQARFSWRAVSDTPGLVSGSGVCIVRAEPVIPDHLLADYLIVVGAKSVECSQWMARVRSMRRLGRPVALLADAATEFISRTRISSGAVTTHWADALILNENGYQPHMTDRLSEISNGIVTAAGRGTTAELVLGLLGTHLTKIEITEIGRHLLLGSIRRSSSRQPSGSTMVPGLYEKIVSDALALMEDALSEPLSIAEIASNLGISQRHLERRFQLALNSSPARVYKQMRTRRARLLLEETNLPLIDVSAAAGFGTTGSLLNAFKQLYGRTPSEIRERRKGMILNYADDI